MALNFYLGPQLCLICGLYMVVSVSSDSTIPGVVQVNHTCNSLESSFVSCLQFIQVTPIYSKDLSPRLLSVVTGEKLSRNVTLFTSPHQPTIHSSTIFFKLLLSSNIIMIYMTYYHNIVWAVGEFSPDHECWGKCKQVPKSVEVNKKSFHPGAFWRQLFFYLRNNEYNK